MRFCLLPQDAQFHERLLRLESLGPNVIHYLRILVWREWVATDRHVKSSSKEATLPTLGTLTCQLSNDAASTSNADGILVGRPITGSMTHELYSPVLKHCFQFVLFACLPHNVIVLLSIEMHLL